MRAVVLRHGQDRELRDRSILPLDAAGALVDLRQVGVHVAGVAAAAGHLLAGGRHLAQRLAVVGHVGEDDQHVHAVLERQELGRGQSHARDGDALYHRIVGQVDEQHGALDGAGALEVFAEEVGFLERDAHGREHHREVSRVAQRARLTGDLRRELRVRQARPGEDRQLLATDQREVAVDGGYPSLDELGRKVAAERIDRRPGDVPECFRHDLPGIVDRFADAVEDASQHLAGDADAHALAEEAHGGLTGADALR